MPLSKSKKVAVPLVTATFLLASFATLSLVETSPLGASRTPPNTIVISNFAFQPMQLLVTPGASIRVINKDTVIHTLSAVRHEFNTGNIRPHRTKTFRAPRKPGIYAYICSIHQYMTGEIIVK